MNSIKHSEKIAFDILSPELIRRYSVVPTYRDEKLTLFVGEAFEEKIEEVKLILDQDFSVITIDQSEIDSIITKHFKKTVNLVKRDRIDVRQDALFIENIVADAIKLKSSDIHFEIYEDRAQVRIRIDGKLVLRHQIELNEYPYLLNKIKIRSGMDISEKRLPQDGRMTITKEVETDIRVSILPTLHGEKVVLRILNKDAGDVKLDSLISEKSILNKLRSELLKSSGIILISGPTGSGKTTTLYAMLKELNTTDRNIVTIEDPVEYTIEGINQIQLRESIGLTFPKALRSVLRQDPDTIMIGEIRDGETAQIAIRAALTGHLILSTIHTNSAWETVRRLIDIGIPGYMLSSTMNTSLAQRLVRTLCPNCKKKSRKDTKELVDNFDQDLKNKIENITLYASRGCDQCFYTGFSGRRAIYELLLVDEVVRMEIINGTKLSSIKANSKFGVESLADQAWKLLSQGVTSIQEVYPFLLQR